MSCRLVGSIVFAAALLLACASTGSAQQWNGSGLTPEQLKAPPTGPVPPRDLTGTWDAGPAGIGGSGQAAARAAAQAPFTPLGAEMAKQNKPGNGPRSAPVAEINDPLSTIGDPSGFPRLLTFELRPFQVIQTPSQVVILYMFEKRYRVIWTDGRQLPADPDPRWYGYSVGRWENDDTFVVQTVGMDDRTWIDNSGSPHSTEMRVEERYHRVSQNMMELTVTVDDPKLYTKPWLARNKLPLRLMPGNVDLMEMIPSASEAQAYTKEISSQTVPK